MPTTTCKFVCTGVIATDTQAFAVIELNSDGSLNTDFGTGGIISTDFAGGINQARALIIQPDNKIVVAGYAAVDGADRFALSRYNVDGTLDATFTDGVSTPGLVITNFGFDADASNALAIQGDGKLVAGGYNYINDTGDGSFNIDFALARYNTDGSLDTSFGTAGKVITNLGTEDDEINSILIQSDGKIVAIGFTQTGDNQYNFALVRYNTNGSLDTTGFGTGGIVVQDFDSQDDKAFAGAIQTDGKIVAVGYSTSNDASTINFAIARFNTNGTLDTSFGTSGLVETNFGTVGSPSPDNEAFATAIQPDGKIIAVGRTTFTSDFSIHFALARYNTNGSLDTSFGTGGLVTTDFSTPENQSFDDEAFALVIRDDGTIVLVGNGQGQIVLAAYNPDGSLNTSFGTGGKSYTGITNSTAYDLAETCFSTPTPTPTPTSTSTPNVFGWSPSTDIPIESWKDRQSRLLNWTRLRKVLIKVQDQDPYKSAHDTLIDYEDNTTHPV